MDRHMKPPRHVRCNMQVFFDGPEALQGALLGVVTELSYDRSDGALCVTGGIGDTGLHEGAGRELVIGQPQLNRAMRQLRHDIYS